MQAAETTPVAVVCRLMWLAIVLVTTPVLALGPPAGAEDHPFREPPGALQPQAPATEQAPDTGNAPRQVQKPAAPRSSADSFTPSERIKADSAVSFPVDI
jgi:hypothetical protein